MGIPENTEIKKHGKSLREVVEEAIREASSYKLIPEIGLKNSLVSLLTEDPSNRYQSLQNVSISTAQEVTIKKLIKDYDKDKMPLETIARNMLDYLLMENGLDK